MHVIADILGHLFAPPTWLFWIPLGILIVNAVKSWRECRDVCRKKYRLQERWGLAIPSLAIIEIAVRVLWFYGHEQTDSMRDSTCNQIAIVFLSLLAVTAYLVYRFRGCRKFAAQVCLVQLWIAFALTFISIVSIAIDN